MAKDVAEAYAERYLTERRSFGHDYDNALVDAVKIAERTGLPFVENLDEKKIIEACW